MARNEEKANAMLNKWLRIREDVHKGPQKKRPFLASECDVLKEAEKWRLDVIREITKKVAEIQNAGLGEHRIRDLNDEINKLLREKGHWEKRIVELGGPNYRTQSNRIIDAEGKELPNSGGYRYFGAARDLPGVRELFLEEEQQRQKRTRAEISRNLSPDYYGWRDEEDGVLLRAEAEAESQLRAEAVREWHASHRDRKRARTEAAEAPGGGGGGEFRAHVALPSREDVEKAVLERRKQAVLQRFLGDGAGDGGGKKEETA